MYIEFDNKIFSKEIKDLPLIELYSKGTVGSKKHLTLFKSLEQPNDSFAIVEKVKWVQRSYANSIYDYIAPDP